MKSYLTKPKKKKWKKSCSCINLVIRKLENFTMETQKKVECDLDIKKAYNLIINNFTRKTWLFHHNMGYDKNHHVLVILKNLKFRKNDKIYQKNENSLMN